MQVLSSPSTETYRAHYLLWILGLGVLVRLGFFAFLGDMSLRTDEIQYQEMAINLAEGRGFALDGRLTSWRPPLYPFVLSVLYTITGTTDPVVVRVFQAILNLINGVVVYLLGRRLFGERVGLGAALLFTLYPSFFFYNNHLLTEVVFAFLLTCMAYGFALYLDSGRLPFLAATGIALGLAVLTREIVWPMVGVMALLAGWVTRPSWPRWIGHSMVLLLAFLCVTAPWVIRNTRLQGTFTLIATNGGMVLLAGHYEHTPADRPWRSHGLDPELKVRRLFPENLSEGETQRLAVRRAVAFIREHPGLTLRNAVIKAANVWGFERGVIGTLMQGHYGTPHKAVVLLITAAIFGVYALTALGALFGLCYAIAQPGRWLPWHLWMAIFAVFTTLAHAIAAGHPRYHLPLIPLLTVYAAHAWFNRWDIWHFRHSRAGMVACVFAGLLVLVWCREIFVVDFERFVRGLLSQP